jgi:hypothetical protein
MCLRVKLDARDIEILIFKPFEGAVVYVGIEQRASLGKSVCCNGKTVVLGSDVNTSIFISDRLVCSPVPEFHFICLPSECETADLVAHADAINRQGPCHFLNTADCIRRMHRVARTVTDKERIRPDAFNLVRPDIIGKYKDIGIAFPKAYYNIFLDAEVDYRDFLPEPSIW